MADKKPKFHNIGTMMLAKKKDPNNEDEPKKFYIKLQQQKDKDGKPYGEQLFPITLANGKVLKDGDILAMFSKKARFNQLVEENKMKQEDADRLSGFLLFDVCAVEGEKESEDSGSNNDGPNF